MAIIPIEQISRMVVNLREATANGEKVGTGILVLHKDRPFILTAQHVANDTSINGTIVIKGAGDLPISIPIRSLVPNQALKWVAHHEADLAAFEIFPQNDAVMSTLQERFLPIDFFFNNKAAPNRNIHLTSIGFPLGLGVHGHFSPLMFESRASSGLLTLLRADTQSLQTFFALENPSVGGYSGCPVVDTSIYAAGSMVTTGGGTCFYGVMHGTISDNTGGKIAMVTPSFYVHELFAAF
jgi:hypothetical protein